MSYPPEGPPGGQYPPPPGFGQPPGYNQGGFGPPPPGYGPGGPGGMGGQPPYQEPIPNYMWQAIVLTVAGVVCCCS
nr:hypothetical protein [Micromonospora sp. DSM 115978]